MAHWRAAWIGFTAAIFFLAGRCPLCASPGTSGAGFLSIPTGGRPAALGGAYAALATDAYAPVWNPGGLGFLSSTQLTGTHLSYLESMRYEFASFVHPIRKGDSFGAAIQYLNPGHIDETDEFGNNAGNFSGSYAAYSLSFGHALGKTFSLGLTGKLIHSSIAGESAEAYAADFGGLYQPHPRWTFGAVVANVGNRLQFIDTGDELPRAIRAGVGYRPGRQWALSMDGNFPKSDFASFHSGVEYSPISLLALRVGYRSDPSRHLSGVAGLSAGVGLRMAKQEFNYTWTSFDELGTTQYFSLLLQWPQQQNVN